jgi:hypothetical protein
MSDTKTVAVSYNKPALSLATTAALPVIMTLDDKIASLLFISRLKISVNRNDGQNKIGSDPFLWRGIAKRTDSSDQLPKLYMNKISYYQP